MLPREGWALQEKVAHRPHAQATARFDVEIASVATAVPQHKVLQDSRRRNRPQRFFPHLTGLPSVFANTGIESRYVCEPPDWYLRGPGLGGAHGLLPAPCAGAPGGGHAQSCGRRRHRARRHRRHRRQHHHRPGDPEPRGAAPQPSALLTRRSSACRSSGSAAAAASAGSRARSASPKPCPAATCSSSPSICAACARAATT